MISLRCQYRHYEYEAVGEITTGRGNRKDSDETCPSATFSITNAKSLDLGLKSSRRGGKPELRYGHYGISRNTFCCKSGTIIKNILKQIIYLLVPFPPSFITSPLAESLFT
jgi:hypothetical protein